MSGMSYLSVVERYHEHHKEVHELLASILSTLSAGSLFSEQGVSQKNIELLAKRYPFIELCYGLNQQGIQVTEDLRMQGRKVIRHSTGLGCDRADRPYFKQRNSETRFTVTSPYISIDTGSMCVSAMLLLETKDIAFLVIDVNLGALMEFIMGDSARRRFSPLFTGGYIFIVLSLFLMVLVLMLTVCRDIYRLFTAQPFLDDSLQPFSVIIFITLALSIFDLGKTILEEEILMHKDIFRHSATRRTITRFVSTILIALSIEALLTLFKASLGQNGYLTPAVLLMLSVVGVLCGLGVYVYLGAKAELLLIKAQRVKGR